MFNMAKGNTYRSSHPNSGWMLTVYITSEDRLERNNITQRNKIPLA